MFEADRRDQRKNRLAGIRSIETPAETYFEDRQIDPDIIEVLKRRRRKSFEIGRWMPQDPIGSYDHPVDNRPEVDGRNAPAVDSNSLLDILEMGRRVETGLTTRCTRHASEQGRSGSFAVGPGNQHYRVPTLRLSETGEQPKRGLETQTDPETLEACQGRVEILVPTHRFR